MKMRVEVHRDYETLRPKWLEVKSAGKKLRVDYDYGAGDVFAFDIKGRPELLPTLPDIFKIVDAKRLDRIGTIENIENIENIESIDLIDLITKISEITTIKNIEQGVLSRIDITRNFTLNTPTIQNGQFEEWESDTQLIGWKCSNISKYTVSPLSGEASILFPAAICYVQQMFEIPLEAKYVTKLSIVGNGLTGPAAQKIRFYANYTDGTSDSHVFELSYLSSDECDLTPYLDTAKIIAGILIANEPYIPPPPPTYGSCLLDMTTLLVSATTVIASQEPRTSGFLYFPAIWADADPEYDGGADMETTFPNDFGQTLDLIFRVYKSAGAIDWNLIKFKIPQIHSEFFDLGRVKDLLGGQEKTHTFLEFLHIDDVNEDYVIHYRNMGYIGDLTFDFKNYNAAGNKIKLRLLIHAQRNPM